MPDRRIALEITALAGKSGRSISYRLRIDDVAQAADISLTFAQLEELQSIGELYRSLFDRPAPAQVKSAQLETIGVQLFDLWLSPCWQRVVDRPPPTGRQLLVIDSDQADILNLPWELLIIPGCECAIGVDRGWGIYRYPRSERPPKPIDTLEPGPLRVLFLAASPTDFAELDHEREEEFLVGAVGNGASLEIGDLGTYQELKDRIDSFQPHIVHLSGHASIGEYGAAFVFEDERGAGDRQAAQKLASVFRGSGVRCVFVSGCGTAQAPPRDLLGGICQSLVANGVPLAVGWAAAIVDNVASAVAKTFYNTLQRGRSVDIALANGRESVRASGPGLSDPSWSLPVLYSSVSDLRAYDETKPSKESPKLSRLYRPLPKMAEGYARQFTGRRRELQALLPSLRDGSHAGVFITGMTGIGKSSLATRVVRRLEADRNFKPIIVTTKFHAPLRVEEDFLDSLRTPFAKLGPDARLVNDRDLPVRQRLEIVVEVLNEGNFTLVLDDFHNNLDRISRQFHNEDIKYFYECILDQLVGESRLVVTSQFLPAGYKLPVRFIEVNLGEFSEANYLKFILRDDDVRAKYLAKSITRSQLLGLRLRFGSAPQFAARLRDRLRTLDTSTIPSDINLMTRPRTSVSGPAIEVLEKDFQEYCTSLQLDDLYNGLGTDSCQMLSRTAVHFGSLSLEAISMVSGAQSLQHLKEEVERWRNAAFVSTGVSSGKTLWSIYGTLRGWLTEPDRLNDSDRKAAHKAAAQFFGIAANLAKSQQRHSETQLSELDFILLARSHCLSIPDGLAALKVSSRSNEILLAEHRYDELVQLNKELLEYVAHPEPATWVAKAYLRRPDYLSAKLWYKQSLALAKDEFPLERGHALQGLAIIAWHKDRDDKEARNFLVEAMNQQQSIGDLRGEGLTLHQLGSIDFDLGNYTEARSRFDSALALFGRIDAKAEEQPTLHQLGSIDLQEERFDDAKGNFQKALDIARALADTRAEAAALHQLGRLAAKVEKNPWVGLPVLRSALELRQRIGDGSGEAQSFRRMGELLSEAGEKKVALRFLIISQYLYDTLDDGNKSQLATMVKEHAEETGSTGSLDHQVTELTQEYLRDRGKRLLDSAFALRPRNRAP